jgi:NCS1 family nucleobase:cation symporter-1
VLAFANLGVIVALVLGFVGHLLLARRTVREQEALPVDEEVPLSNRKAQEIESEPESVA